MSNEINWMNREQIAEHLGVTVGTVYVWRTKKGMPHHRTAGVVVYDPDEIDEWRQPKPATV